jgi:membrane-associated phospholipid phosphatase
MWPAVPVKLAVRRADVALFGVPLALSIAALVSRLAFDDSILTRARANLGSSPWIAALKLLGKAWLQIWLLLLWFRISRRRRHVLAGLVALILVAVVVNPLKLTVARARPYAVLKAQRIGQPSQRFTHFLSFPSGDTATVFACGTAILPAFGWPARVLLLAVAAGVGALRVAVRAHYPSDVLAGAAIGILLGWLAIRLIDRWGQSDRPVPYENGLVWMGVLGIPLFVGILEGWAGLWLVLKTYGPLILCILLAAKGVQVLRRTGRPL